MFARTFRASYKHGTRLLVGGLMGEDWNRQDLYRAADGGDLAACVDGTCAVRMDKPVLIPLDPRFQFNNLRVESIVAIQAAAINEGMTVLRVKPEPPR